MKAAVGDLGDAAGNIALVASTCARRRLFGTADEENLEFNADPCSARRLRAGGLVLSAMSETFGCLRVRDACCCSFVGTFFNRHYWRARGSLFVHLLQGQRATSMETGQGVICGGALERLNVVASGTNAVATSGTVYN